MICPLESVPIVLGIGLNYRGHAIEAGVSLRPNVALQFLGHFVDDFSSRFQNFPSFSPNTQVQFFEFVNRSFGFNSHLDTLAGPFEDIPVHPEARELDYEGELCIVIGKDVKNLTAKDDPLEYVLGFTVGNDVSSRYWQKPDRSGAQHGPAKSFDKFAPIGPVIASTKAVRDAESLRLRTWVNDELRQDGRTDDLIFGTGAIIRHLSRGITLRKGTVIMTGTPR